MSFEEEKEYIRSRIKRTEEQSADVDRHENAGMLIFPRERGTFPDKSGDPRTLGREVGTLMRTFGPGI
jgi:hypothetical protein